MHTYHKRYIEDENGNDVSTWLVGFAPGDPGPNSLIAEFMSEEEASAYASFLNGGAAGSTMPADARKAVAKHLDTIAKAKAAKAEKEAAARREAAVKQLEDEANRARELKEAEDKAAIHASGAKGADEGENEVAAHGSHGRRHR